MRKVLIFLTVLLFIKTISFTQENRESNNLRKVEKMQQRCNDGSTSYQADSCSNLGTMYFSGDGVQKDLDKAAKYYYKACETGKSPDSCKVHNQIMQMMEMQNK